MGLEQRFGALKRDGGAREEGGGLHEEAYRGHWESWWAIDSVNADVLEEAVVSRK